MAVIRPLVAGNWKMNGLSASLAEARALAERIAAGPAPAADVMICPPATLIERMSGALAGTGVLVGGQDCHAGAPGAHTGDIAAEMLADAGASAVIVGHSERRTDHGEDDQMVRAKAQAAHRAGLCAIVCIGETKAERKQGKTIDVVMGQLAGSLPAACLPADTVIAYEPVWAIGTGLIPTPEDIGEVHQAIRGALKERMGAGGEATRILYGGSVKPDNAAELMAAPDVNGALVGGASLKADDFYGIVSVYCASAKK